VIRHVPGFWETLDLPRRSTRCPPPTRRGSRHGSWTSFSLFPCFLLSLPVSLLVSFESLFLSQDALAAQCPLPFTWPPPRPSGELLPTSPAVFIIMPLLLRSYGGSSVFLFGVIVLTWLSAGGRVSSCAYDIDFLLCFLCSVFQSSRRMLFDTAPGGPATFRPRRRRM